MSDKLPNEISKKMFLIRGHRVMLDVDLAHLYGVKTGNLNKAVWFFADILIKNRVK